MAVKKTDNDASSTLLAFTLGAAIGGGLALMMAPRSGSETRKKLQGMVDETSGQLKETVAEAEGLLKKAVQDGVKHLEDQAEQLKAAAKSAKS